MKTFAFLLLAASLSWTEDGRAADASAMARADTLFAHEKWNEAAAAYGDLTRNEPSNARAWMRLGAS